MKKYLFVTALLLCSCYSFAQEFTLVTTIEPGAGVPLQAKMIINSPGGKVEEIEIEKVKSSESVGSNGVIITDKISSLVAQGWELDNVYAGSTGTALVTRYLLKKEAPAK